MQSRLGKQETSILSSVALAGCIDEEGVVLQNVSNMRRDTKESQSPKLKQNQTLEYDHFDFNLLEFNEDNANIRDVIAPQNRSLTGKRGSNKSTVNSKGKKTIPDEGKYEDDLAFLNKFN